MGLGPNRLYRILSRIFLARLHGSLRYVGGARDRCGLGRRRRREGLRKTTQMTIRRCRMLHFVATARACTNVLAASNEAIWKYGAAVRIRGEGC